MRLVAPIVNLKEDCPVLSAKALNQDTIVSTEYRVLHDKLRLLQLKPFSIVTFSNELEL